MAWLMCDSLRSFDQPNREQRSPTTPRVAGGDVVHELPDHLVVAGGAKLEGERGGSRDLDHLLAGQVEGLDDRHPHDPVAIAGVLVVADVLAAVGVGVEARLHPLAEGARLVARLAEYVLVPDVETAAVAMLGVAADRRTAA